MQNANEKLTKVELFLYRVYNRAHTNVELKRFQNMNVDEKIKNTISLKEKGLITYSEKVLNGKIHIFNIKVDPGKKIQTFGYYIIQNKSK